MRVGDRDRGNPTQSLNPRDGIASDKADAVPKNITGATLNQKSTLANGELRFRADAPNSRALWIERVVVGVT